MFSDIFLRGRDTEFEKLDFRMNGDRIFTGRDLVKSDIFSGE